MLSQNLARKNKNQEGYTLVEVLVSIAIFALVLVVALGSILTILDASKKARTLTSVMNNVHFTIESLTRSFKTGVNPSGGGTIITVEAIDYESGDFIRQDITFRWIEEDGKGRIEKRVGQTGTFVPMTSPEVDIDRGRFVILNDGPLLQPRILMSIVGSVALGERIQSKFSIQTTVSQRRLNF